MITGGYEFNMSKAMTIAVTLFTIFVGSANAAETFAYAASIEDCETNYFILNENKIEFNIGKSNQWGVEFQHTYNTPWKAFWFSGTAKVFHATHHGEKLVFIVREPFSGNSGVSLDGYEEIWMATFANENAHNSEYLKPYPSKDILTSGLYYPCSNRTYF